MTRISVKNPPAYRSGYAWESVEDVVDVPDGEAAEMLRNPMAVGFYEIVDPIESEVFIPSTEAEVTPPAPDPLELPTHNSNDLLEALDVAGTVPKRPRRATAAKKD